jgi:hypothetical protein
MDMNDSGDFTFFGEALNRVRRLKTYTSPWYIFCGARETGGPEQLAVLPKMISEPTSGDGEYIFETTNYAVSPGHGLPALQEMVGWALPPDLAAFYELYEKALVITRTHPLHLWPEEKMLSLTREFFRDDFTKPLRVFRFGDQYDREATQFGMWLEEPGTMKWRVISTAVGCLDDLDDDYVEPERILASSFSEWLKDWINRDGLPDPFMELGLEGGYVDPA